METNCTGEHPREIEYDWLVSRRDDEDNSKAVVDNQVLMQMTAAAGSSAAQLATEGSMSAFAGVEAVEAG